MNSPRMLAMFYRLLINQYRETIRVLEDGSEYERGEKARELRDFRRGLKRSLRLWQRKKNAGDANGQ